MTGWRVRNRQDFWSGLLFMGFGGAAVLLARDYPLGSTGRMGPGYFPTALGAFLLVLGAIIALRALRIPGKALAPVAVWPLGTIVVAIAAFGLAITFLGLVPAILLLIAAAGFAGQEFRPVETAVSALLLALFSVALFVWGLGLPFTLFGPG